MPASPLDDVRIARPCPADWASMAGTDRARHCGLCRRTVYDLSAMTRAEATAFLLGAEGRTCVRLYRRADGTVLTRDCPGPRPSRAQKAAMAVALAGALVASDAAVDAARGALPPGLEAHPETRSPDAPWGDFETGDVELLPPPVMGVMEPPPPPPPEPPR